jgi:glycine C-acetyltransferase
MASVGRGTRPRASGFARTRPTSRAEVVARGFDIPESDHPIVPIMIVDAVEAAAMADRLLAEGIYVRAFSFPVVPRGKARIRTQTSDAHSRDDLDQAITAFETVHQ